MVRAEFRLMVRARVIFQAIIRAIDKFYARDSTRFCTWTMDNTVFETCVRDKARVNIRIWNEDSL